MSIYHESYLNNPLIKVLMSGTVSELTEVLSTNYSSYLNSDNVAQDESDGDYTVIKLEHDTIPELVEPNTKITPLCQLSHKSEEESLEVAKLLIEKYKLCNPNHVDLIGQTCMFYSARDGRTNLCSYFCKYGCDPNHKDRLSQTCMFYAARDGHANVLEILINYGANVNITDTNNQTCLFYAARDGRYDAVKLLLEKNINAAWKDSQKRTALTFAKAKGHNEIVNLIKKATTPEKPVTAKRSFSDLDAQRSLDLLSVNSGIPMVNNANVPQKPKKYRLQYRPFPEDDKLWLDAPFVKVQEFEIRFPELAKWSKDSPFPPATSLKNPLLKQWYTAANALLSTLLKQEGGYVFDKPVDPKKQNCPDYYDIIKNPMSFSCIRGKLRKFIYTEPQQFLDDVRLIFENCFKYNKPETWIAGIGHKLEDTFKEQLVVFGFNDFCAKEESIKRILSEAQSFVDADSKAFSEDIKFGAKTADEQPNGHTTDEEVTNEA